MEEEYLIRMFEDLKGYSTDIFDNEDWEAFKYFTIGYKLALGKYEI